MAFSKLRYSIGQRWALAGISHYASDDSALLQDSTYQTLSSKLAEQHAIYVSTISSPEMAMSLELTLFLLRFCISQQPQRLLDLGSGFSSYVFRLYQQHAPAGTVEVYSVDDHAEWLEKTHTYLENQHVSTEHLYTLDALQALQLEGFFDLILLDLNFVEVRRDYIAYSGKLLAPTGKAIIDDVHKTPFLLDVKRIAAQEGHRLQTITEATRDHFGRFAILLQR